MSRLLQKPTLLLVTDQFAIISWMRREISGDFYLLEAESQEAALDYLNQAMIDLVIVDGKIARAFEICSSIRKKLVKRSTPILLITGRLKRDFRDAAFLHGVTDFISDQLDIEELQTRIAATQKMSESEDKIADLSMLIPIPTSQIAEGYFKNRFLLHDSALRFLANAKNNQVLFLLIRIDQAGQFETATLNQLALAVSQEISREIDSETLLLPSSRLGEFVLLMRDIAAGMTLAETLQTQIKSHPFETREGLLWITLSIVIGSTESNQHAFEEMVDAASKALGTSSTHTNLILPLTKDSRK